MKIESGKTKSKKYIRKILQRKRALHLAARIHAGATIFFMVFYLGLGFFGGPEYLIRDIRQKQSAIAQTVSVSLTVPAPPGKPDLEVEAGCIGTDPRVYLDWEETHDTYSYAIYRNGEVLEEGQTRSRFQDTHVSRNSSYSYYVVAQGFEHTAKSNTVEIDTLRCPTDPTCWINRVSGSVPEKGKRTPWTTSRAPTIVGSTNMPEARLEISLFGEPEIFDKMQANKNGYWSWTVPKDLEYGPHIIRVTAYDPIDESRYKSASLKFIVWDGKEPPREEISEPEEIFSDRLDVQVTNPEKIVFTGKYLEFRVAFLQENDPDNWPLTLEYNVLDSKNIPIMTVEETLPTKDAASLEKKLLIGRDTLTGEYGLQVLAKPNNQNRYYVSRDDFTIKNQPFLTLGSTEITYAMFLSGLGWVLIASLLFLLAFLALLIAEHHQSLRALRHITEDDLKQEGIIT